MRYLAAYLLLVIGGNSSPSSDDIRKVLGSVGVEVDDVRVDKVVAELEGKDVNTLIAAGSAKLASVPSGGAVAAAPTAAGAAAGGGAPAAAAAVEEEEKKEEKEESDDDMGFGLFD